MRMLLLAVTHLLFCALASAAPGAKEPRRASLLHGATSDGMQECFAPFLHRQVEYHLEANAAWGFGSHVAKDSTNVSATVLVSTQLAAGRDKLYWVHTLEVVRLWRTKSYAAAGSPQTVTASMPDDSARFRIRILQRECNSLDDIIHSPDVSPQEVDFARGLASMIVFALPSGTDLGESIRHDDSRHGHRTALLSIHRVKDFGQYVTHVTRVVNETRSSIFLDNGNTVPLRDEIA